MDPEFSKLLMRVMIVGGAIGIIGAGALFLAFRAFALRDRGFRAALLVAVVIAFVFLCCALLVRLSIP